MPYEPEAMRVFDSLLRVGDPVLVRWTWFTCRSFERRGLVEALGPRWVRVRLIDPPIDMPEVVKVGRYGSEFWTEANSVWPPAETRDLDGSEAIQPAPEWAVQARDSGRHRAAS